MKTDWKGVYPAATTAFKADESLDLDATAAHLDKLVSAGMHGMVVLGTVGENHSLEYEEKLQVLRTAVDAVDGRVPVITGVAQNTTKAACRFAKDAERAGIDGLMVLPAMIYKSDARETVAHFRAVARASSLPIMAYNNPVSYGVDLTPEHFAELADEKSIVAIKESSDNPRRLTDLVNLLGDRYVLFSGVDDLMLESMVLGSQGWISGLVNAFPEESLKLWDLALAGRYDEALAIYRWYTPLLHLDTHPKLVQYIKLAMAEAGMGTETCRAPRLKLEGEERRRILGIIRKAIETRPVLKEGSRHGRAKAAHR
jgi:4-hydroxy-tetrahydrodipicolinate synthase